MILFFSSRGCSFLESRTETWEFRIRNREFFSSMLFLCLSNSSETESNLSCEKLNSSRISFCIKIISFFILDSESFLDWNRIWSFSSSDFRFLFSSSVFCKEVRISSEFCFVRIRFWYSMFKLFVSLVKEILFSFSVFSFSFRRFSSEVKISFILIDSFIFWRSILAFSFILLYLSIPNICRSVSSLTSGFS